MKRILPILALSLVAFVPQQHNPLRNTKWEAPNGLVLHFTNSDTVRMIMKNQLLASALYKVKDSLVIWRDYVKSEATCDTSIRGTYIYHIKDSLLNFKALSDRCEVRADVIQTLVLARQ